MANPNHPSSDQHRPDPAPPVPARARGFPWTTVAVLVFLAANLALCVRRVGDRGALAFIAFAHLNLLLLFWSMRRFELSPPGSVARGRAKLAVWLLTASLTAAFTWKMCALLPPPLAVAACIMAASTVGGGFYVLFVHDAK
ncbi:hypothetical protein EJB05_53551, partial [Eragrostis curvula]